MDIYSIDKLRHCPNCDRYLEPSDFVGVYCKRCDDLTKQEFDPTIGPKEADRSAKVEDPMGRAMFDEPIDLESRNINCPVVFERVRPRR